MVPGVVGSSPIFHPKILQSEAFASLFLLLEVCDLNASIHRTSNNNELTARCNEGESGYFVRVARILLNIFSKVSSPRLRRSSPIFHPNIEKPCISKAFFVSAVRWQIVCIGFDYTAIKKYNCRFMPRAVSIAIFMLIFVVQKNKQEVKQLKSIQLC